MTLQHNYNQINKNRIRRLIVDKIRPYNIKSILTLESPSFLFSKLLPDKKIIVFEKDGNIMQRMRKSCPRNVDLIFGNITKFEIFNSQVDFIYLDFCGTWFTEEQVIIQLKESLKNTKLFGITLCVRKTPRNYKVISKKGYKKQIVEDDFQGDYQFDILRRIQEITEVNWKVVYGESYFDSVQMVTMLLENNHEITKN